MDRNYHLRTYQKPIFMSTPANHVATYEDLFSVPDNMVGEIIAGELITQPRPSPRHSRAGLALGGMIIDRFDRESTDGTSGWWILAEPECHLGADILVLDIAGWRRSTMPEFPETAWIDVTPDWVCEIVSPSTQKYDRTAKRDIYAREQIPHYWIVDPIAKLIEVFALENDKWTLLCTVNDTVTATLEPFEEMPFDLGRLWV